jgi:alkanesulfonate monooxygenase SsuD/methylene tetrahydromethanopterin reductase-like flavin-dependent oxidoreductase (luciferase family)
MPHSLRLAGEVADGVRLHSFCTRRYLEQEVAPRVTAGLAKSGRSLEHFEITGGGFIATGPDDAAVARMFEWVRARVAFYGSTPGYWPVLELHGLGDLGRSLNEMSKQGRWEAMTASVPDDVVHLFAAVGTHREIAGAIERRFGGVSDAVNVGANAPGQTEKGQTELPHGVLQDIRQIPARFTEYRTAW